MRKYLIILTDDLPKVDFNQILETSPETLVYSIDKLKTIIKWATDSDPDFLDQLISTEGPYTNQQMLEILETPEWCDVIR